MCRIAARGEKDRAWAIGNLHKNLLKFGRVVFELCERTDRQTNKQTNSSQYLAHLPGAK